MSGLSATRGYLPEYFLPLEHLFHYLQAQAGENQLQGN